VIVVFSVVLALVAPAYAVVPSLPCAQSASAVSRCPSPAMGRAERRAAEKRAKKGGAAAPARGTAVARDVLSKDAVLIKLREVPVFGLLADVSNDGRSSYLTAEDGFSPFFLDAREAETACTRMGGGLRVDGVTLDKVFFDPSVRLKPSDEAMRQARAMVKGGTLDVSVPLFAIDGMQTKDKESGVESTPLFFSRSELLEFGKTCMDDPESAVLLTDLGVVVNNMLNGPAGLLRRSKLFPTASSLTAMDKLSANQRQALFPGQANAGPTGTDQNIPDVFKGVFGKW